MGGDGYPCTACRRTIELELLVSSRIAPPASANIGCQAWPTRPTSAVYRHSAALLSVNFPPCSSLQHSLPAAVCQLTAQSYHNSKKLTARLHSDRPLPPNRPFGSSRGTALKMLRTRPRETLNQPPRPHSATCWPQPANAVCDSAGRIHQGKDATLAIPAGCALVRLRCSLHSAVKGRAISRNPLHHRILTRTRLETPAQGLSFCATYPTRSKDARLAMLRVTEFVNPPRAGREECWWNASFNCLSKWMGLRYCKGSPCAFKPWRYLSNASTFALASAATRLSPGSTSAQ